MDREPMNEPSHAAEFSASTHAKEVAERRTAFRQHIEGYENTADSLELGSALVYVTGDLLMIADTVAGVINQHFEDNAPTVESLREVTDPMDDLMKLARQVDRYGNLQLRIEELRSKSTSTDNSGRRDRRLGFTDRRPRPRGGFN